MVSNASRLLLLLLSVCLQAAGALERYEASEPHMGTLTRIVLWAESEDQAQVAFVAGFQRIAQLDHILSDYVPGSELSRACPASKPMRDLRTIIERGIEYGNITNGAFDFTAGNMVRVWREARQQKRLPDPAQLSDARSHSGLSKLHFSSKTGELRCDDATLRLDAGGFAKGYAAEQAVLAIRGCGVSRALVAIGGDIATGAAPATERAWIVESQGRKFALRNESISTSGDESQYLEVAGVRYSHIVDPRTGEALRNSPVVTVIGRSGMDVDAMATAFSVMREDEVIQLARKWKLYVLRDGKELGVSRHGTK